MLLREFMQHCQFEHIRVVNSENEEIPVTEYLYDEVHSFNVYYEKKFTGIKVTMDKLKNYKEN